MGLDYNIYIGLLYLCILEEHTGNCLISGGSRSKLGYRANAPKIKPSNIQLDLFDFVMGYTW